MTVVEKEPEIIYVTSITLDTPEIEAIPGTVVTLIATVLPEDATDKTIEWSSSNENVATVDQEGTVTIISVGSAVITAATTDGSGLKAECIISGVSWIASIVSESNSADVYSPNGLLIKKDADSQFISNLTKGTYIIRIGTTTYKIIK